MMTVTNSIQTILLKKKKLWKEETLQVNQTGSQRGQGAVHDPVLESSTWEDHKFKASLGNTKTPSQKPANFKRQKKGK